MDKNNIKEWYVSNYPTDELGESINPKATLVDLFNLLDRGKGIDVYEYLGVGDSIIRERVFERLAWFIGVPYNYIYEQWLLN
jgi:hypothetical protein